MTIEPFIVSIPERDVKALKKRLALTRWAPELPTDPSWSFGVDGKYLRYLIDYWQNHFDWYAQQDKINAFPHFKTVIDDTPIHFIHVKGEGSNPVPIILSHGWPWTFWDFHQVIDRLANPSAYGGDPDDSFDVVVPSLPGFIFSGLSGEPTGYVETARLWTNLMHRLGYKRFIAHGGDAGAFISAQLGHAHPDVTMGVHLNLPVLPGVAFDAFDPADFSPEERAMFEAQDFEGRHYTHLMVHIHEPQTLAWAMHDSPVGQVAWMLHRRRAWSDCGGDVETRFDRDTLLTHMSLFWFTNSFATSIRTYRASGYHRGMQRSNDSNPAIPVPTAVAVLPAELAHLPRSLVAAHTDLRQWTVMPAGGHFAAAEEPERIADDIRNFVRPLRGKTLA